MPIEFACDCGKRFQVPDGYAGKRSKCTACKQPVTVPTPPPASAEESAEDAALRALTGGDDPEPAPRIPGGFAGRSEPTPPRPMSSPSAVALRPPVSPARKESAPTYRTAPDAPKRKAGPNWVKVGGGIAMAVVAVVWFVLAWGSGWIFAMPIAMFFASPFFIIDGFRERSKT